MSNKPIIKDNSDPRKYFAMIPNLADRQLDPYAYRLYGHLLSICGGKEEVQASTKELALGCQMSTGKVIEAKRLLAELGYIDVLAAYRHRIIILDIWAENMRVFSGEAAATRSYSEQVPETRSPHERVEAKHVHHMNKIAETRSPHEQDRATRSPHEQHVPNTERSVHVVNVHQRENAPIYKYINNDPILLSKWKLVLAELMPGLVPATAAFIQESLIRELEPFADGTRHFLIVITEDRNIAWVHAQLGRQLGNLIQQIIIGKRASVELTIVSKSEYEEVEGIKEGEDIVNGG